MRVTTGMIAVAILAAGGTHALAQMRGTPQEQRACRGDVAKLCREGMQDEAAIVACLQKNREKLSKACQDVLIKHGQ